MALREIRKQHEQCESGTSCNKDISMFSSSRRGNTGPALSFGIEQTGACGRQTALDLHWDTYIYPNKYAHGFVVLSFVVVMQSFIMNSHEVFIHIHQGCFAGTGAIVRLPHSQWSKPVGYGKINQCITTTKHSKAKTVCIFLGIYCTLPWSVTTESSYCMFDFEQLDCQNEIDNWVHATVSAYFGRMGEIHNKIWPSIWGINDETTPKHVVWEQSYVNWNIYWYHTFHRNEDST